MTRGQATGVVAAGHPATAEAAASVLKDGGNAFDAALAGMLAACVPEVVLASPGGGGFLMAFDAARGRTVLYDFFAQTPRVKRPQGEIDFHAIHADFGPATQEFHIGAGATAVPGMIPGLFAVHGDLARLPIARILAPTIDLARQGVTMSAFHAYLFTVIRPILTASKQARALFAPSGKPLAAGEIYRNPALAGTLEALGREGERLFREGEIGQAIVHQSREQGGHLTGEDLTGYRVERRRPLDWRFGPNALALNPAPAASGPLIAFGLGLAERLGRPGQALDAADLVAIMQATNAARARYATGELLAEGVLTEHLALVSRHASSSRGTTHISVIDGEGNAAAATISNGEGNGLMLAETGVMLNNMLGEEDLNPSGFHAWPEASRLSSMMAPTIIRHGDGGLTALGSGGSNRIRTAILQVALKLMRDGEPLEVAIRSARLHLEKCGTLSFEDDLSPHDRAALVDLMPDARIWPERNMFFGGVHAAGRTGAGALEGAGDPRRSGVVRHV